MSRGLRRAQAMQGGGDREGPIMVLESEVGPIDLFFLYIRLCFRSKIMKLVGAV